MTEDQVFRFVSSKARGSWEDCFEWTKYDAVIIGEGGKTVFRQDSVEFPVGWDQNSVNITAQKYFYGDLGSSKRESSLKQVIHRVVEPIANWAEASGVLKALDMTVFEFENELAYMVASQRFAWNSPVWFNVGTCEYPQTSACFILSVEDSIESIAENVKIEMMVFKHGSGAGSNRSALRSKREKLSNGGHASGPLSFIRTYDAAAGSIKSGGKTRRAAKMEILNIDHLDIEEFITHKRDEERKAKILVAGGVDGSFCGEAYSTVAGQNANYSIRVSDVFMNAVQDNAPFVLRGSKHKDITETVPSRKLWDLIGDCAWECADPGVQFDDQIQKWHTCKSDGKINATNPCSEYVFLDDTSCNLGSHNLEKYYVNGRFDAAKFAYAVSLSTVAMDALINYSSFPTMQIGERTRAYRTLGVGYTALGALLMRMGLPYDSATGRQVAAGITSLMSAAGYAASARMAEKAGAFSRFSDNRTSFKDVMRQHQSANESLLSAVTQASAANLESQKQDQRVLDDAVFLAQSAQACWNVVCEAQEFRNAQISVLAPTGTISFMMGSQASTGIEPILGLVTLKNLAGGGVLRQVNPWVKEALTKLGIEPEFRRELLARIENTGSLHSQTGRNLSDAEAAVFSTSFADPVTGMSLHWNAHVSMMAICQPFISGAISKTVNLPESATVKDIQDVYFSAWNMGLKCIAVYRDGCKGTQAIGTLPKAKSETTPAEVTTILAEIRGEKKWGEREKTGLIRPSITTEVKISDGTSGTKGYLTIGLNADHQPCELFMTFDKVGGTVQGLMHAWCKSVSFNLQLGMSVTDLARAFMNTRFDPSGATTNPDVRTCASIVDFVAKFLLLTFDPASLEEATGRPMKLNPLGVLGRVKPDSRPESTAPVGEPKATLTGRTCGECGTQLVRIGACEMCTNCSTSTGCGG